jgi:ribosomal protein L11 methyltransferase
MTWLELSVEVDPEAVESVGELLAQHGYNNGVVIDQPIIPGADGPEYAYDTSRPVTLRTYLPLDEHAEETRAHLERALWHFGQIRPVGALRVQQLEEQDWADAWKQHYTIQRIGERAIVVPSWLEYDPHPGDVVLRLDPGMAFGTGLHPTTQLCVALLERYVRLGCQVLDLGCGSGILAITAAKLGAGAVLALDTDPIAVTATCENVERNGVSELVRVAEGSLGGGAALGHWLGWDTTTDPSPPRLPSWSRGRADDRPFASAAPELVEGQGRRPTSDEGVATAYATTQRVPDTQHVSFDLIVANIIARVLAALAADMAGALTPGGTLIASGIIAEREAEVAEAFVAAGLAPVERRQEGDWVALVSCKSTRD